MALKEVWAGGDTQEARGEAESSNLLPGEAGGGLFLPWASHSLWEGGFLSAEEPFVTGLTQSQCAGTFALLGAWLAPKVTEHK